MFLAAHARVIGAAAPPGQQISGYRQAAPAANRLAFGLAPPRRARHIGPFRSGEITEKLILACRKRR
jgi:hypothetical protein